MLPNAGSASRRRVDEIVESADLSPSTFEVTLDMNGQARLIWHTSLTSLTASTSTRAASAEGEGDDDEEADDVDEADVLPPGHCTLSLFPRVDVAKAHLELQQRQIDEWTAEQRASSALDASVPPPPKVVPKPVSSFLAAGAQLAALEAILLRKAQDASSRFFATADAHGAYLVHSLVAADTDEAIDLAERLFEANPDLLAQVCARRVLGVRRGVRGRGVREEEQEQEQEKGRGDLYAAGEASEEAWLGGQSLLHLACALHRPGFACRVIDLAEAQLERRDFEALLRSQASGPFFEAAPMVHHGGTALAYACAFGLKSVVIRLLATGLVSLGSARDACALTGFLPLHAAVAAGRIDLFDFLTSELPEAEQADPQAAIAERRVPERRLSRLMRQQSRSPRPPIAQLLHGLTPLQLAAALGDHSMFRHLLRRSASVRWSWGGIAGHAIDLTPIDSAGGTGREVMALVGGVDASPRTTELLRDDHLQVPCARALFPPKASGGSIAVSSIRAPCHVRCKPLACLLLTAIPLSLSLLSFARLVSPARSCRACSTPCSSKSGGTSAEGSTRSARSWMPRCSSSSSSSPSATASTRPTSVPRSPV